MPSFIRNILNPCWARSFELFQSVDHPPVAPLRPLVLAGSRLDSILTVHTLTIQATNQMFDHFGSLIHQASPLPCISFLDSLFLLFDPVCVRLVNLGRAFCVLRARLILDTPSCLIWPRLEQLCTHYIIFPHLHNPPPRGPVRCTLVFEFSSPSAPARDFGLNFALVAYNLFPSHNKDLGIVFPSPRFPTAQVMVSSARMRSRVQAGLEAKIKKYFSATEAVRQLEPVSVLLSPTCYPA